MKLGAWLIGLGAFVLVSCAPPVVNELESLPQREIVHVSGEMPSRAEVTVEEIPQKRVDGVLESSAACRKLVSDELLFDNAAAQNAWNDYQKGNYAAALTAFGAVADKSGDDAERQKAYFMASMAARNADPENGDAAAASWMKHAYEIDAPLRRTAAVHGMRLGYASERWQDVAEMTEFLAATDEYRTYRCIALTNLGQYEAAAAEFGRIGNFPRKMRLAALEARARAESETSQLSAALKTYRRIYELNPKSEQGQIAEEAIMAQKDRWPKDFEFPRAPQKIDRSKSARETAQAHFDAHRSEKAISAYKKLLQNDKKRRDKIHICEDLYAIARSHVKLRKHDKSLPYFKDAIEACKKNDLHVKVLYSAGKAAWNADKNEQALAWYQQIIDDYASHSYADDAFQYQALILRSMGKEDESREKLRAQIRAYPDGDMAKDAYWMLMSDLYDRKLWDEAVKFADEHIDHAGESDLYSQGRLRYFQARAYEHLNDGNAAVQNYLNILAQYPLSYYAMLSLGRLEASRPEIAREWIAAYRPGAYKPDDVSDYCFQVIGRDESFDAARSLTKIGLYDDALDEIDAISKRGGAHVGYETKLARALILRKAGRHTDSARIAAGMLHPMQDLVSHAYAPWLLAYPKPWNELVSKAARPESDLYYTAYAIMREESYYNPRAESWANARGLMQLMLPTAQSSAEDIGMPKPSAADLFKPEIGIPIGASYIEKLYNILVPHPMFVLPGYNAGQGNVGKWLTRFADVDVDVYVEKIPFKEARHYAKRVGTTLWRYRWLYDENMPLLFDPAVRVGDLNKNEIVSDNKTVQ